MPHSTILFALLWKAFNLIIFPLKSGAVGMGMGDQVLSHTLTGVWVWADTLEGSLVVSTNTETAHEEQCAATNSCLL